MEFLVRSTTTFPSGMSAERIAELRSAERALAMKLRADGILRRLWRIPGRQGTVGLYRTRDATHLHEVLTSLPLFPCMSIEVEALATHPQEAQESAAGADVTAAAPANGASGPA
ncbi:muconolactone Delta-isomerase family protein [Streptomyces sp. NPDC047002]|uniref:muconolactone Delta-isomerase family protein n=1 Tax=Streptomyces sp. NPDC047002 TaxID=3155475 RepID=UPI0034565C51